MTASLEFILLSTTRYGENALILHTLSQEYGRRSFITRVGKKTSMALFLPLNILEADITQNPKSDLWNARGFLALEPLGGIRDNLYKNTIALFMSEVLFRTLKDGANEDGLYEWLLGSILALDALESDWSNFHLRFLLELSGALGFRPTTLDLAPFAGDDLRSIDGLLTSSFADALLLPLNGSQRKKIAEELLRYLEFHTESSISVRSLDVLHDVFL